VVKTLIEKTPITQFRQFTPRLGSSVISTPEIKLPDGAA